ncbi:MAG: pyruvate kinase [Gammaproteobacteria bacterium]|nr:pyruvate kinase [Gammaproteobacteria bacterium]
MPVVPQFRKTKIIATIGPASDSPDTLEAMIRAGLNVARLNLSHGTFPEHQERIRRIRAASSRMGMQVAIMVDTRGIEIRTGKLDDGSVELTTGEYFILYTDNRTGDKSGVSVSNHGLPEEVGAGTPILLDDGAMELEVSAVEGGHIKCKVIHGGLLRENKSVNLPETELALSSVSPEYREDVVRELSFAAENDVDYVAASFVQKAADIYRMREVLVDYDRTIPIIAKIENRAGLGNLQAIVEAADGVMVARGDLGVELPLAEVPCFQKKIIRMTVSNGKPVVTATEMLASMERNPKPTRAEASDVANAILDGSSAVMLSGETAMGKYPVEAVKTMATLAIRAESSLREYGYLQTILPNPSNRVADAIAQSAVSMAHNLGAAAIYSLTDTGFTSRLVSKHRPDCPILAVIRSERVARRLSMNWGVTPILYDGGDDDEAKLAFALDKAREMGFVASGDTVVVTSGYQQTAGGTDLIRIITLEN